MKHLKQTVFPLIATKDTLNTFLRGYATKAELIKSIDWTRHARKSYIVVNPFDPSDVLYLSPREFKDIMKTALANEVELEILATPSSQAKTSSDSESATSDNSSPDSNSKISPLLRGRFSRRLRTPKSAFSWAGLVSKIRIGPEGFVALRSEDRKSVV